MRVDIRTYSKELKIRIGYRYMYFILSRSNRQCSSAELASLKNTYTCNLSRGRYIPCIITVKNICLTGEGLGYAFYFLIESEFQRCSGVFELSKKSKVYPNRDA